MTTCKKLGLKALRLERQGKQLEAAEVWDMALDTLDINFNLKGHLKYGTPEEFSRTIKKIYKSQDDERIAICAIRARQARVAGNSELHSAANSNTVA